MFYGQCNNCNERWELATPSTCKCVEVSLGNNEVLRVTPDGQFTWHPEADAMISNGDFTASPALPFILRVLYDKHKVGRREAFREIADKIQTMPFSDATIDSFVIWLKEQE